MSFQATMMLVNPGEVLTQNNQQITFYRQQKKIINHYTHLIIHGYLHLLGYEHENKIDEKKMETKEIKILKILGIKNPYLRF